MEIVKSFQAGEIIYHEGEPCESLLIIKTGTIEIFKVKEDREIILNIQNPGEVVGLLTFFSHGRRLASARAQSLVEGVLILRKDSPEYDSINLLPQWVQIVLKEFTVRLEQMNEKFMTSTIEIVEIKKKINDPLFASIQIANCITEFGPGQAVAAKDGRIVLVYEELKALLGRTLEYDLTTVDRVFKIFEMAELLKIEKDSVSQREFIDLEGARSLHWYPEFFRSKPSKNKKLFQRVISEAHKKVLFALCDYVQKTGGRPDQIYHVEIPLIDSCLGTMTGIPYDHEAIDSGAALGLIEIKETALQRNLHFHPNDLRHTLQVIEVVSRLRLDPHNL